MLSQFRFLRSIGKGASVHVAAVALATVLGVSNVQGASPELSRLSIEDLMQIEVTSVSKRAQPLAEAAAAVYVITSEDIRRSGATSIPEALRLAPGLHVARIDASRYAITARGFNMQFANKLLVLIDGRSVYTHLFSGVYWDVQDVPLEDVDRIEVVRGPGGTLWGANAVNGVINIITKKAKETQGWMASGGGGSLERAFGTVRYGAALTDTAHVRGYVKYSDHNNLETDTGEDANDQWDVTRGGYRLDWDASPSDAVTLQGDLYDGGADMMLLNSVPDREDLAGGNILARWRHVLSETSYLNLQAYYDRTERESGSVLGEKRNTADVDFEHRFRLLPSHDLIWGWGYRLLNDDIDNGLVSLTPDNRTDHLLSAFIQDQITIIENRLQLTVGSKLEHNDYTGFEFQPTARALWKLAPKHSVWTAVSRAVRTPARIDDDGSFFSLNPDPLVLVLAEGNRDFDSEELLAYEVGYRAQLSDDISFDVATYYNDYDGLRSGQLGTAPLPSPPFPPGVVALPFDNETEAAGYGVEVSTNWRVTDYWAVSGWYTLMKLEVDEPPRSSNVLGEGQEDDTPINQVHVGSRLNLPWHLELDSFLSYVSEVSHQDADEYARLDVRLGWRPTERIELSVAGQNLTERRHEEFGPGLFSLRSYVPRSVYGKVTLRY